MSRTIPPALCGESPERQTSPSPVPPRREDKSVDSRALLLIWTRRLLPLASVLVGLSISAAFMPLLDQNPLTVLSEIFALAFRDAYNIADIFAKATPLILVGLAFGFCFRGNLFNIGAQGQFYMGAIASAVCSLHLQQLPAVLLLPLCVVFSLLAGGIWASFAGWCKARFHANEFLVSLMSTYVAIAVVDYLMRGPLKESRGVYPQTDVLADHAWIPALIPGTRFHWGFVLALGAALLAWYILWRTGLGYRIRAVGMNRNAARYAGIDEGRIFMGTFFIAGAFAGLAGFMEVNGVQHMMVQNFQPTLGAEGIGIAILGNSHPLGIVLSALLFGVLKVGGLLVTQTSTIPPSIINIMEGCVMVAVILSYFAQERISVVLRKRALRQKERKEEARHDS